MSKYEYHPNPRTNGDTGIYTTEDGIDSGLVGIIVGGVFLIGISVVSYLWGKARGRKTTLEEELLKNWPPM